MRWKLRRMRAVLSAKRYRTDVRKMLDPVHSELGEEEVDILGSLYESRAWGVFCKYMNINRAVQINSGLIHAKDLREAGEVQGYIGSYNKIEFDMMHYHNDMQERKKQREISDQKTQLETDMSEEENQPIPSPFEL